MVRVKLQTNDQSSLAHQLKGIHVVDAGSSGNNNSLGGCGYEKCNETKEKLGERDGSSTTVKPINVPGHGGHAKGLCHTREDLPLGWQIRNV